MVACLACAVLAVSAGCRSTGGAGASSPPLDGEVSVCGLATVDQIQQTVGRQIEEFAISNASRTPNNLSFMCVINVSDDDGTGVFELEVSTTFPDGVRTVPAGSTFEDVAAAPKAEPVTLDSVSGQGAVIPDDTGRQIPSFAINNNPDPPDHVSLWCAIGVADSNDTGRFDLRVTTTYPRNIDSVPTGSTFEDVAAAPKAEPITLDSVPGQGAVIPDNRGHAILVWSYPDTDTVATLRRVYPSGDSPAPLTQDAADLEDLFTLIGPAAPQAADGPEQSWSMYPTDDRNPAPTP